MKVLHLHCVPRSCFPLGPRGRLHIQKDRPQLTPGFLVSMVLQGSSCSHLGAIGLANNLPQVFLTSKEAASSSTDFSVLAGDASRMAKGVGCWAAASFSGEEGRDSESSSGLRDGFFAKKPLRLCWPFDVPLESDLLFFAAGGVLTLDMLRFRPLAFGD